MKTVPLVIPVKAFARAKHRLSPRLGPKARAELAQSMATNVVKAAEPFTTMVVCDDQKVADWAKGLGVRVIWCEGTGLNGAVQRAEQTLGKEGYTEMIVAHSDLVNARDFSPLLGETQITIVPDQLQMGTNVLRVPLALDFRFGYGTGSFSYHLAEAARLGLSVKVLNEESLSLDIDLPGDLDLITQL